MGATCPMLSVCILWGGMAMGETPTPAAPSIAVACRPSLGMPQHAWECHALHAHIGAVASRLATVRSGSFWAQVVVGMGCRV